MEEKEMTLAEALSANRTETRSEAVPDFDLERLAKEIDAVFQMKFKIGLDHVTEQSSRLVRDTDGKLTKILDKIDVGIKQLYKFTFSDGSVVEACGDHLWGTYNKNGNYRLSNQKLFNT